MKRLFKLLLVVLFVTFAFGCKNNNVEDVSEDEKKVLEVIDKCKIIYGSGDSENSVTQNIGFNVPSSTGVNFKWQSSNLDVIKNNGEVTRQDEDVNVIITVTGTLNIASYNKSFNITVKAKIEEEIDKPQPLEGDCLANADFTGLEKGATPIIDGWTLSVTTKGAYDTGWLSMRNTDEYVITSAFDPQTSVIVSFTYYLQNYGTTKGTSSKIKFIGLNASGSEVSSVLSDELNVKDGVLGSIDGAKTITATITGENIVKVKVQFVKDGGGNIGFSNIKISKVSE